MRKLLFFIILLPVIISFGHDVYIYTQDQGKGFRLSDVGALWDKYHKQSHDQWKNNLHDIEDTINDLLPTKANEDYKQVESDQYYVEGFSQNDGEEIVSIVQQSKLTNNDKIPVSNVQNNIGFILEQKAVFVFGGFAAIIFVLNFLISLLFKEKTSLDKLADIKKKKKNGLYGYNRK